MQSGFVKPFLLAAFAFTSSSWAELVQEPPSPLLVSSGAIVSGEESNEIDRSGGMPGVFRVNESGAATYSIPLELPAGIAGVTPSIALSYSSSAGVGLLGYGWGIDGIKGITRCRQTLGTDGVSKPLTLSNEDRFCLGGQRLIFVNGTRYGAVGAEYRLEMDDFSTIVSYGGSDGHPDYFEVKSKDGATYTYGAAGNASVIESEEGVRDSSGQELDITVHWALNTFEDNVGNKIDYNYYNDNGGFRVANIKYAYSSNSVNNSQVVFVYDNGEGASDRYIAGYKKSLTKRLKRVNVRNKTSDNGWQLLSYYSINYDGSGRYPIAISNCNSASVCKKPTEFFWSPQGSPSFSTQPDFQYRVDGNHERVYGGHQYADINSDGRLDFMWLVANYDNDWELRDLSYKNVLSKSNENGEPDGYSAPEIAFFKTWKGGTPWEWKLIDYNGDGRSDFATFNHYTKRWDIYLSRYDNTLPPVIIPLAAMITLG